MLIVALSLLFMQFSFDGVCENGSTSLTSVWIKAIFEHFRHSGCWIARLAFLKVSRKIPLFMGQLIEMKHVLVNSYVTIPNLTIHCPTMCIRALCI